MSTSSNYRFELSKYFMFMCFCVFVNRHGGSLQLPSKALNMLFPFHSTKRAGQLFPIRSQIENREPRIIQTHYKQLSCDVLVTTSAIRGHN